MALSRRKRPPSFRGVTVLVVDKDDDIRYALGDLLQDEGYAVMEAETLPQAELLIDEAPEPTVLVIGNTEVVDCPGPQCLMAVAANPVTRHAYLYLMSNPKRHQVPALIQRFKEVKGPTIEKPYELAFLLAVVAAAATQLG
jgi:DNA-binding NtrC family response regulator